jgi:hypothetical protein
MDRRDAITRQHFHQQIVFRPAGDAALGDLKFDADVAARLTGAPDGAIVTLEIHAQRRWALLTVTHPMLVTSAELIVIGADQGTVLRIDDLRLAQTGSGMGARMFAHQARAARALGFCGIVLWAGAGVDAQDGLALNGLYAWARLGFDAPLPYTYAAAQKYALIWADEPFAPTRARIAWLQAWPATLRGAASVRDVMQSEAGRHWWRACPDGSYLRFDCADGASWHTLHAYLHEKGICIEQGDGA